MKQTLFCLLAMTAFMMVSCSSEVGEQEWADESTIRHTAVLHLDGDLEQFDVTTRATSSSEWEDGATLYIQYKTPYGIVQGVAVYSLDQDAWEVNWYGTITKGQTASCEVYFFAPPKAATMNSVELDAHSLVYADKQATYFYEDGMVTLKTNLKFLTGRLRFFGQAGTSFIVSGLKWYSAYDISANALSAQATDLQLTIDADGYTPYVYTEFADIATRTLTLDIGEADYVLTKRFDYGVLTTGRSGRITVPSLQSHNGWTLVRLDDPLGLCPNSRHPHVIDLGLDVKFSCCNLGAFAPADYGDYFAWGELEPKGSYTWENYKWCKGRVNTLTKYCLSSSAGTRDNKLVLEPEDDAAHVILGGTWRMPAWDECARLVSRCTWTWTKIGGVNGCKVTASNGNSIFLPAAGYRSGSVPNASAGSVGHYWTTRLQLPEPSGVQPLTDSPVQLYFSSGGQDYGYSSSYTRIHGLTIRPVTE